MRLPIQRSLLIAFGALTVLVSGSLAVFSYLSERHLVEGLSTEMVRTEQALMQVSLRNVFEPPRVSLSINLNRLQMGVVSLQDTDALRRSFLSVMRETDLIGSMMVGDEAGYQWLLMRYDDSVVTSPLLEGQTGLPAVTPDAPRYFTREFHPGRWGETSHWTIWDATGSEVVAKFDRALPGYDPRQRAWHRAALDRLQLFESASLADRPERVAWSHIYELFTSKTPGISASGAVRTPDGRIAIVAFDLRLEDLSQFTQARQPTPGSKVFIVTDDGALLGLPHDARFEGAVVQQREALLKPLEAVGGAALAAWASQWRAQRDAEVESFSYAVDGDTWWGSFRPFELDGAAKLWVGVAIPENELLEVASHNPERLIWLTALALVVAGFLAHWIARGVSRPIEQIVRQSQRIGDLDLEAEPAPTSQLAEVQDLGAALGRMRQALVGYVRRNDAAHAELQASEDRFRSTFELAGVGVLNTDLDGTILFANERMAAIVDRKLPSLLGTRALELSHPEDAERDQRRVMRILEGKAQVDHWEKRYVRPDGTIVWAHIVVSLRRDVRGAPMYFIAVVQDISERIVLESRLRQSQKLEAVGRLAGGVAHDFNNLLTVISGYASLMKDSLGDGHPIRGDLDEIEQAVNSASALTRQLLTYARQDVAAPSLIDAGDLLRDNEKLLARLVGNEVQLHMSIAKGAHGVFIDPVQLQQVLVNLVINARDAMPDGGDLRIRLTRCRADDDSEQVMIQVEDSGVGMPEAVMLHVFEPFFTTKQVGQGTGLGLSTCYGIVRQAGGTIEVDSTVGRGATFTILLPWQDRLPASAKPNVVETPARGSGRVLLVEDEPRIRELLERSLTRAGFDVVSAGDGNEAMRAFHGGRYDILISDVVMPLTNGGELADQLRSEQPDLPVLFLSGYSREVLGDRIPEDVELMTKPFAPDEVVRRARGMLDRGVSRVTAGL